jgi:hypothetical protein
MFVKKMEIVLWMWQEEINVKLAGNEGYSMPSTLRYSKAGTAR